MESGTTLWTSVVRRLGSLQHQMVVNCLCPSPPSSGMQTFLLCRLAAREAHSPKLQASHASSPSYWSCIPCALTRRQDLMPDLSSIRRLRREPPPNQRMKLSACGRRLGGTPSGGHLSCLRRPHAAAYARSVRRRQGSGRYHWTKEAIDDQIPARSSSSSLRRYLPDRAASACCPQVGTARRPTRRPARARHQQCPLN